MIDEKLINTLINEDSSFSLDQVLSKAEKKQGLSLEESAFLLKLQDQESLELLNKSANKVKSEIYGNRLVLFAPLYISDFCINDCEYCGFHCRNKSLARSKLDTNEIRAQTELIIKMGHKRILLEAGEHPEISIDYVCDAIRTIYDTKVNNGEIRRVNVNIAATSVSDYKKLKEIGIGTYQLFQETYHRQTYEKLHKGPKADYDRQITAHTRAFEAGIDDYGIGVLFGLYDYKFEVLSLLSHAKYMEEKFGVGPHTISVPRFQKASTVDYTPEHPVSDSDFLKLIAVIRLSVPYTGMIISTRESPEIRQKAFEIGISQTSAASKTSPGGYSTCQDSQFELSDHRSVDQVIQSMCAQGKLPSFCTACYRSQRTGEAFMKLAKTGNIHFLCHPNAILTFKEFLVDYASLELKKIGEDTLSKEVEKIQDQERKEETKNRLKRIENGERDLFF
ncbi:MAG: [FeFe] hydrogenase H-cluster radical SAM maturase HydG [Candidatus Micrarchaeota archaeon]